MTMFIDMSGLDSFFYCTGDEIEQFFIWFKLCEDDVWIEQMNIEDMGQYCASCEPTFLYYLIERFSLIDQCKGSFESISFLCNPPPPLVRGISFFRFCFIVRKHHFLSLGRLWDVVSSDELYKTPMQFCKSNIIS